MTVHRRRVEVGFRDPVTGLRTLRGFLADVDRALSLSRHEDSVPVAVIVVDIHQLRTINGLHGYGGADEVLRSVAAEIEALAERAEASPCSIARSAGGTFMTLVPVSDDASLELFTTRLLDRLQAVGRRSHPPVSVTGVAGVAIGGTGSTPDDLVAEAESALRSARRQGPGSWERWDGHGLRRDDRSKLARELSGATERGELLLEYQPKLDLATDMLAGVEALIRWNHPRLGRVRPDIFVPIAEDTGLIDQIGGWVIEEGISQIARWRSRHQISVPVAVNLSPRQFRPGLVEVVRGVLDTAGVAPASVTFEVTEGTVMRDVDLSIAVLSELRSVGVHVSIDDFGTGYSSLAYLRQLPVDEVKIDRSFVMDMDTDPQSDAVVAAIVSLAQGLGHTVVAEGVETAAQLRRLRELGCDRIQGFLYSRPLPEWDVVDFADTSSARFEVVLDLDRALGGAREVVLVVDDEQAARSLVRLALTTAGFGVLEAETGEEASSLIREHKVDYALLDLNLPDVSGHELCREVREGDDSGEMTIVMLTSHAHPNDKAEAFHAGADDYMVKPFAPRDLVARMRRARDQRRSTRSHPQGEVRVNPATAAVPGARAEWTRDR